MLYLKNLSSQQLYKGVMPWEFVPTSPIPEEVRGDKAERDAWINRPTTDHHVYTFCEGVNPNLRISKMRNDGEGNPVHSCWAAVGDFDANTPEATVLEFARKLPYPPNYIERTLSGNWRFVWLFEEPLIFPSYEFAKHFFKTFEEFAFDPARGMIGFDRGAWLAPERLYTNSCDWRKLHDVKIPADVTRGWMVQASAKFKFDDASFGIAIPLDVIKPELERLFPKFAEWPGDFSLNSQGPTFWIEASTSPKSAIVRETGIQTFSANAAKGFYGWSDLLGVAFTKKYETEAIGRAVANIHFDGRSYWRPVIDDSWQPFEKTDISLHLKTSRGVSSKPDKSGVSEIDRALEYIQSGQRIVGAAPFVFRPSGILTRNNVRILNTSTLRAMQPAEGTAVWGANGQFPWVSSVFMENLLDETQLSVLLAWTSHGYKAAYTQKPTSGQVLFIAGPPGHGKTLLNRAILGAIFGGIAEAADFLLGQDNFNAELFRSGYWCVDDATASSNPSKLKLWGSSIKRVAANPEFRCNEKFRTATLNEWLGRLGVTLNADEESTQILPDLSNSILDKLMLLRTLAKKPCDFPPRYELEQILKRELPWFCRWLLDHKIPDALVGDTRFGVKAFAEPSLLDTANQSSRSASFAEILDDWKTEFFTVREPKKAFWEGTSYQLHKAIMLDPGAEAAMRHYTVESVGRALSALKNKGAQIETLTVGESRVWRIHREQKTIEPKKH